MPIPTPNGTESHEEFMQRCMSDPNMGEYSTDGKNQRAAVCYAKWDDHMKGRGNMMKQKSFEPLLMQTRFAVEKAANTKRVKGFFSTTDPDRHKDVVSPSAFKLNEFMANPMMLVNHDYWIDARGNKVEAGKAITTYEAKVLDIGSNTEWGIMDLSRGLVTDTYPKERDPALQAGDMGVFIVGEITQNDVWGKIQRGELNGFSWKGIARGVMLTDNPSVNRVYDSIDLWEVSLVTVPDQPKALLAIAKSAVGDNINGTPMICQSIKIMQDAFDSKAKAEKWLKEKGYDVEKSVDTYDSWIFVQKWLLDFDLNTLQQTTLKPGVMAIIGKVVDPNPRLAMTDTSAPALPVDQMMVVGVETKTVERPSASDVEALKQASIQTKENVMADNAVQAASASTTQTGSQTTKTETQTATPGAGVQSSAQTTESVQVKSADLTTLTSAITQLTEVVTKAVEPFKGLNEAIQKLPDTITAKFVDLTKKSAETVPTAAQTKVEQPAASAAASTSSQQAAQGGETIQKSLLDAIQKLNSTMEIVSKSAVGQTGNREEQVTNGTKKPGTDPNACFDGLFAAVMPRKS